jgi:hypothetical protein
VRVCRKENRRIANGEMKQETEQEDCEQRDETGNRGNANREMRPETEQGDSRKTSEDRKKKKEIANVDESGGTGNRRRVLRTERLVRIQETEGEDLKECAGDFVVFTYESRIFAGMVAQVKKYGSLIMPCNLCNKTCCSTHGVMSGLGNGRLLSLATLVPKIK